MYTMGYYGKETGDVDNFPTIAIKIAMSEFSEVFGNIKLCSRG